MLMGMPGEAVADDAGKIVLQFGVVVGDAGEESTPQRALAAGRDGGNLGAIVLGAGRVLLAGFQVDGHGGGLLERDLVVKVSKAIRPGLAFLDHISGLLHLFDAFAFERSLDLFHHKLSERC